MTGEAFAGKGDRIGMARGERAKQFSSFEALSERPAYLKRAEFRPVARIELSEEAAEELNRRLIDLVPGDLLSVTYFRCGEYLTRRGRFLRIDLPFRRFYLDDLALPLDDLYAVSTVGRP
ncbi:MAG: YolD-like family protein [Clostridia bacterium]|nr:YolD-like family protein [Clostridia bacterium]